MSKTTRQNTPKTPFETENNASRVKARRNRRLAECVGCGQKAHSRMIALAEFAQAMPYCKKRLLPCQRRQALVFPERQTRGVWAGVAHKVCRGLAYRNPQHCRCVVYGVPYGVTTASYRSTIQL